MFRWGLAKQTIGLFEHVNHLVCCVWTCHTEIQCVEYFINQIAWNLRKSKRSNVGSLLFSPNNINSHNLPQGNLIVNILKSLAIYFPFWLAFFHRYAFTLYTNSENICKCYYIFTLWILVCGSETKMTSEKRKHTEFDKNLWSRFFPK